MFGRHIPWRGRALTDDIKVDLDSETVDAPAKVLMFHRHAIFLSKFLNLWSNLSRDRIEMTFKHRLLLITGQLTLKKNWDHKMQVNAKRGDK